MQPSENGDMIVSVYAELYLVHPHMKELRCVGVSPLPTQHHGIYLVPICRINFCPGPLFQQHGVDTSPGAHHSAQPCYFQVAFQSKERNTGMLRQERIANVTGRLGAQIIAFESRDIAHMACMLAISSVQWQASSLPQTIPCCADASLDAC